MTEVSTDQIEEDDEHQVTHGRCHGGDDLGVALDDVHRLAVQYSHYDDTVHNHTKDRTHDQADHEQYHNPRGADTRYFTVQGQVGLFHLELTRQCLLHIIHSFHCSLLHTILEQIR